MVTKNKHVKSRQYADEAHKEVGDKYGDHEYVFHLDYAFDAFLKYPPNPAPEFDIEPSALMQMVGDALYMHDVIEDTKKTKEDITEAFNATTAWGVKNLSNIEGKNRKETIQLTLQKYSTFSIKEPSEYISLVVKPYDRYANFHYSVTQGNEKKSKTYFEEHQAFKKATYREGIADKIWDKLDEVYIEAREKFGFIDESTISVTKKTIIEYEVEVPEIGDIKIQISDSTLSFSYFGRTYSHTWNTKKSLANFIVSNDTDYLIDKLAPMVEKYHYDYETFGAEMREKIIEMRKDESISSDLARTIYDIRDWSGKVSSNPYEPLIIDHYDKEELSEFVEFNTFDVPMMISPEWTKMEKIIKVIKIVIRSNMGA